MQSGIYIFHIYTPTLNIFNGCADSYIIFFPSQTIPVLTLYPHPLQRMDKAAITVPNILLCLRKVY